jgi:hypothetical protein
LNGDQPPGLLSSKQIVLPADVALVPIGDLLHDITIREFSHLGADHVAIIRPASRAPPKVVDPDGAALLRRFRTPHTIVQAVAEYSGTSGADTERTLVEAAPMLVELMLTKLLVAAGSPEAGPIKPSLASGLEIVGLRIRGCVSLTEDTEVYLARHPGGKDVALKILRPPLRTWSLAALEREAEVLARLDDVVNPALLAVGSWQDRPYLLLEWRMGVPVTTAAAKLRSYTPRARQRLKRLCCAVLEAYAYLHAAGVVHGDVHPGNVLVTSQDAVSVLDYGNAAHTQPATDPGRPWSAGVLAFCDPERARALHAGLGSTSPSALGEQYSLAVLVDLLLAGAHYLRSSQMPADSLSRVLDTRRSSFARRGAQPWPETERILDRALDKVPGRRFLSVAEFAARLRASDDGSLCRSSGKQPRLQLPAAAAELLAATVSQVSCLPATSLAAQGTDCSVARGAAGIAYALLRLACQQQSARLLAFADAWATRAVLGGVPEGEASLYYGLAGAHVVRSLVSSSLGDVESQLEAIEAFLALSWPPPRQVELSSGNAGLLLACALLLEQLPANNPPAAARLQAFGSELLGKLCPHLDAMGAVASNPTLAPLGIAHGRPGPVLAALRWCQTVGRPLPPPLQRRLDEVADQAQMVGVNPAARGRRISGWCSGSAGHVFLWALAYRTGNQTRYLGLAEGAAFDAWIASDSGFNLCCGLAGRSYALLSMYELTGDKEWLRRARELATRAAELARYQPEPRKRSLFHGRLGVAILVAEQSEPALSRMPLLGDSANDG